ncbi:hypothetical protein [Metabacillus halosaccharovorans]|uniref:hypothetical protein n=1 Tax=Metabacillus halosaccharovorans TaxID=930124 RepID=UPI0009950EEC|nr:hypothetical protein [Metabacillus halosaccharovorans]
MKKIGLILLQFTIACAGIILVGALPSIFHQKGQLINNFFDTIGEILFGLIHIQDLKIVVRGDEYIIYPYIVEAIVYSFSILFIALIIAYLFSIVLSIFTMLLPKLIREKIKFFVLVLESFPDLLVIILLQLFVIYIYKNTGFLLMKVVTVGDERAFLLPIISLAIIPTVQLYRISILLFEEELIKNYVLLSKSKGLKWSFILFVHVLRNITISLFFHSKKTIWFMLSALVVVEVMNGIKGITFFLTQVMVPEVFTIILLGFFTPIFFVYHLTKWIIERTVNNGGSIS